MICGLLGAKLGYSYSPVIHAQFNRISGRDYSYTLMECPPDKLEAFLINGKWDGLNVTIPYKKAVIPYCSELSPIASELGSVNTLVKYADGRIYGDNTDYYGFCSMVRKSGIAVRGSKALVLGSGGASATVVKALYDLGADRVIVISRSGENNYENLSRHYDADIIVNTTPVGTYPGVEEAPLSLKGFVKLKGVLDIIYNPFRTALLLEAEKLGIPHMNGLHMLVAQARKSSEIFVNPRAGKKPLSEAENAKALREISVVEEQIRNRMENIVLIGMPGCGKSTIASILGIKLNKRVLETDSLIEEGAGMSIPDIFNKFGEANFRQLEHEVIREAGKGSGMIISTGGGCVTFEDNYESLHRNGKIIYIRRNIGSLPVEGRPISQKNNLSELFKKRKDLYLKFADLTVENSGTPEETADKIIELLY